MQTKFFSTVKVLLIIGVSYLFSGIIGKNLFIDNSPKVNTANIKYIAYSIMNKPQEFIALFSAKSQKVIDTNNLDTFKPVSKGVYAKEEGNTTVTVIKQNEMETIQYSFVVDGKPLNVQVPANSISKDQMEKALSEMKKYKQAN